MFHFNDMFSKSEVIFEYIALPHSNITLTIDVSKMGKIQVLFSECKPIEVFVSLNV